MSLSKLIKSKRLVWHNHFIPSIFAGLLVALISLLYKANVSNILLFGSLGASAMILTNTKSHHLTKLYTVILSYFIVIVFSLGVYALNIVFKIPFEINLFIVISLVGLALYLFNVFHPPAISGAVAFITLEHSFLSFLWSFLAVIGLLVLWRILVYVFVQKLSIKDFGKEFKVELEKRFSKKKK